MHRRLKSFERRLARIAALLHGWEAEAAREQQLHQARQAVAGLIRAGLERAGLDPAEAPLLRRYETLAPAPPQPSPLRRRDLREAFFAHMSAFAERMRGHPPPLATATPVALLAYYCFGEGAEKPPVSVPS